MDFTIIELGEQKIAEVVSDGLLIHSTQDALDVMANASYQGAVAVLLYEQNLPAEFFNLSTGLAGEILQKYSNYQMKIVIVGAFEKFESKSLKAFIIESNRGNRVAFVPDREAALLKLTAS